jgi:hypothetical protein
MIVICTLVRIVTEKLKDSVKCLQKAEIILPNGGPCHGSHSCSGQIYLSDFHLYRPILLNSLTVER